MRNFDEEMELIMKELTRVSKIENHFEQMRAYMQIPKVLQKIWQDGFDSGVNYKKSKKDLKGVK